MPGQLCYKTEYKYGSVSYSEAFDPDDPTLIDRYPEYDTDKHLGDRPSTPTQQREIDISKRLAKRKVICPQYLIRSVGR